MNDAGVVSEFPRGGAVIKLARSEPYLGTVYSVEGEGTCFHVVGLGFLAFLPGLPESMADMCQPFRGVSSVEAALAGLVLAARAHARVLGIRLEGDTDV